MNLTKYLPFESYVLTTHLSITEVYQRLSDNIEPKKTFRLSLVGNSSTKPYEGEVSENSFSISRIISYRNSFLPIIQGEVSTDLAQTRIKDEACHLRLNIYRYLARHRWPAMSRPSRYGAF